MSNISAKEMEVVERFIIIGEYFEALELIDIMIKWENLDNLDLLKVKLNQVNVFLDLGRYKEGLKAIKEIITDSQKSGFREIELSSLIIQSKLLIYTGRFKESLDNLLKIELKFDTNLKKETTSSKTLRVRFLRLKGVCYRATGENELAESSMRESLKIAEELENELEISKTLDRLALMINPKDTEEALKLLKRSLIIRKEIGNKYLLGQTMNRLGIVYLRKGMLDESLAYYIRGLEYTKSYGNKDFQAIINMNIGTIYENQGKLNKSLENYIKSLNFSREVDNKSMISASLYNISAIYRQRGELDKALEYQEECLVEFKQLNYPNGIAASLHNIGIINYHKGNLNEADNFLKRSLSIREEAKNHIGSAASTFYLIQMSLDQGLLDDAKHYLNKLEIIKNKTENKLVGQQHSISEALLLKNSARIPKKAKAEELLRNVIESDIIDHEITTLAYLHLSDLLLEELKLTGENEVLEEIKVLTDQLFEISKNQQSSSLMAETLWLKSQLFLISMELNEAKHLLTQAQLIAEEKDLKRLALKISTEYDKLHNQMNKWQTLMKQDVPLAERLAITDIDNLLIRMIKREEITLLEHEIEDPIFLVILNKDGQTLFTHRFSTLSKLDGALIGGFVAAINSFASEILRAPGNIERIKHQEYNLIIKAHEKMLFTYVYKGQSYSALSKLNNFVELIRTTKLVWEALDEAVEKPFSLNEIIETTLIKKADLIFVTNG
ncbi:MAG: tetratricopeptide repeat protein [Candidatus Heimdallarchaeota archaeon]|nr:tetratricopeptide repeat protein [Candidatus Heimdallarchaeota archaeon]MCK4770017.1 tetratricopeptide repeat protein [Candidatus Heimdallarchaeota archaeon]